MWLVSKKMGMCLQRTLVENMLNSFALDCLGKSNACPFAAVLRIALKDIHPPCCPKGGPAATWFLPPSLLCQLLQDRRTNLIFHSHQRVKVSPWQLPHGNLEVLLLVAWKAETLAPCWTAFPSNAGLSSPDRDGAGRSARIKEEESCMPNLPTVGRQGIEN